MKRNARAILLVSGIFLVLVFLNFLFLVDSQENEETEQTGSRSSYRTTPYGTSAYYALLEEGGYPVTRLGAPYTELEERPDIGTLVVISLPPGRNPSPDEMAALQEWVEAGGLLVVIDRSIHLELGEVKISTSFPVSQTAVRPAQPTVYTRGVQRVELSPFANRVEVKGGGATYSLTDSQGAVLADVVVGEGRVVLLTDPFLVQNNGIGRADNFRVALNLLAERPEGQIAFDEFHHGYGDAEAGGLLAYFRGTPVPWMAAQAGLIVLLVVYTRGRRFARPLPLRRERRTTNLEFVSSMANITRLARATDLAVQSIYGEFRNRLCRYSGQPPRTDNDRLAAAVARRARLDEARLRQLLDDCERAARGDKLSDEALFQLVTRIRDLEAELKL